MTDSKQVVLITGASSGIGEACAGYLAERGYRVYGTSRRVAPGAVESVGTNRAMIHLDLQEEDSVAAAVDLITAREARLDAVVNNGGCGISGAIEETTLAEARALFETNFFGVVRVCRQALPMMRAQGGGHLVTISSIAGRIAVPYQGIYNATKFALEGLMETLRYEVAPFDIRVSLIEPGDLSTGFTANRQCAAQAQFPDSPYAIPHQRTMERVEADERGGADPSVVAPLLYRILEHPNPRLRYTVGPWFQRAAVTLRRFLPDRAVEFGVATYYGLR
jgi:NAD(P)-dependent dehydrogenase (short-subunit alcohol dehydrogenase family)